MRPDMLRPTSCDLGQGYTQYVRYDKTILVGNGHTSTVRCGSEPGSWSPNVEVSLARRGRLPAAMAASGSEVLVDAGADQADLPRTDAPAGA